MRIRKSLIIILGLLLIGICSISAYAMTSYKKTNEERLKAAQERKVKVENRVKEAKDDIKISFDLSKNIDQYIELDISTIPAFEKDGYKDYFDKALCNELLKKADEYIHNPPLGSVKPLILINKNGKEVIVAYKEADGKNTMKRAIKKDNLWDESESKKEGSPILKID